MFKFSVITPVHLWNETRVNNFLKTIESVKEQGSDNFEWIIVDDGSTLPFNWDLVKKLPMNVTVIHKQHEERVIAYNHAFKEAQGEWFMLLDSDDEFKPNTLHRLDKFIGKGLKERMINFGCIYRHTDGNMTFRDPFVPDRKQVGHVEFGGGNIVNGTFMWHRSVYDDLGGFPQDYIEKVDCTDINYPAGGEMVRSLFMGSPYDFSAAAQIQYPEMRKFFMVNVDDEPNKVIKELGNPWGQDFYLFYKYTRKYHSKVLKEYLLIVNLR